MDSILLTKKIGISAGAKKAGKRLIRMVLAHKRYIFGGVLCTAATSAIGSAPALAFKSFIDCLNRGEYEKLGIYSLLIVGLVMLNWPFSFLSTYLVTSGGLKVVEDMRNACFNKLQEMSIGYFEKQRTGELMSRITSDSGVVQMFITSGITEALKIPITVTASLCVAVYLSAKLTIICLLVLPFIAVVVSMAGRRMKTASIILQEKIGELSVVLSEVLSSMHVVKYFSMEEYERKKFRDVNRLSVKVTLRQATIRAAYSPMIELLGAIGLAIILFVGGRDAIQGVPDFITGRVMTPGSMFSIFLPLQQIFVQVNRINHVNLALQHAFAASERTFEVMDMPVDIKDRPGAVEIPEIHGNIEFRNVSFEYNPGEPVLNNINVKVDSGMVVALVGHSGSGKSTFVKLLPRFYDVTGGAITIEGVDVRDATIASYRRHFGIVPQDTTLFRATIKENIRYGRLTATDEEIIEAARSAYAHDFIKEMPEGYDTLVGERGVTLSGGQRQRVAIARAILKDPKILILDEATSNVDNVSEKYIQIALDMLMQNRTTFIIAHRLSTIRNADLILVMDRGEIVERGKHDELYALNGVYRRLYDLTQKHDD